MVVVGLLGFMVTIGTAWQGRFRMAAGVGIVTGALLVVSMFVFRPSDQDSTALGGQPSLSTVDRLK
jgi:hypothetical protein